MRKIRIKRPFSVLCIFIVLLIWGMLTISGGVDLKEYKKNYSKVTVSGVVSNKSTKNDKNILYIKQSLIYNANNNGLHKNTNNHGFIIYLSEQNIDDFKIGQRVVADGVYSNFDIPDNQGQFNMRKYYRIKGYEANVTSATITMVSTKYNKLRNILYEIKTQTKNVFEKYLSNDDVGIMEALVLGDKDDLSNDIKELYQNAGISHILSLSGLHIATVGITIFGLLIKTGIGNAFSSIISSIIMVLYGLMTGMSTSTVRALIMFLLGITARCMMRTYDLITAVCFSMLLIIVENPYYVFDSGFQLSVSAVIGIGLINPVLTSLFHDNGVFCKIWKPMCVSISTNLSTMPVIMNSFYKMAIYGVLANLLIVPLAGLLLFSGITLGFLGNMCNILVWGRNGLHKICKLMAYICKFILKIYEFAAGAVSGMKGNIWITGAPKDWQIVLYVIGLFLFVKMGKYDFSKFFDRGDDTGIERYEISYQKILKRKADSLRRLVLVTILGFSIVVVSYRNKTEFEVKVISVGQGACNLITGKNIPSMLIDGGSSDIKDVWKYRIQPCLLYTGINKIDYCFITHGDLDHVSGIKELLSEKNSDISFANIIMSTGDAEIARLAQDKGINLYIMRRGDEIKDNRISIKCLYPEKNKLSDDANDQSLVLDILYKPRDFRCLFTGDISSNAENDILSYVSNDAADYNFMTIAHHGSKYSSCKEFLKYVNAGIYTISAGKNNSYGHPHKETLERLAEYAPSAKVLRTDECGQITVSVKKNETCISIFNSNIPKQKN